MCYIVTRQGNVTIFREKDINAKVALLVSKSMFPLAITVATEDSSSHVNCRRTFNVANSSVNDTLTLTRLSKGVGPIEVMKLYEMYAQYLYRKKDFEGSIVQYCHTIGYVQTSAVIKQFLDPARLSQLLVYLERLHEKGVASKDHTSMLLTCYVKLKLADKIEDFVSLNPKAVYLTPLNNHARARTDKSIGDSISNNSTSSVVRFRYVTDIDECAFDAEAAVTLLKAHGYIEAALTLALRHNCYRRAADLLMTHRQPSDVMGVMSLIAAILFNDAHYEEGALSSLGGASATQAAPRSQKPPYFDDIRYILTSHYDSMLEQQAELSTAFLVALCLKDYTSLISAAPITTSSSSTSISSVQQQYIKIAKYLESPSFIPILLPDQAITFFHRSKSNLYGFVEGVYLGLVTRRQSVGQKVCMTLYEMYLEELKSFTAELKDLQQVDNQTIPIDSEHTEAALSQKREQLEKRVSERTAKAVAVLDCEWVTYDLNHALLIAYMHEFEIGKLHILERMNSTGDMQHQGDGLSAHTDLDSVPLNDSCSSGTMSKLILQMRMERSDFSGALTLLQQESERYRQQHHDGATSSGTSRLLRKDSELYKQALQYIVENRNSVDEKSKTGNDSPMFHAHDDER